MLKKSVNENKLANLALKLMLASSLDAAKVSHFLNDSYESIHIEAEESSVQKTQFDSWSCLVVNQTGNRTHTILQSWCMIGQLVVKLCVLIGAEWKREVPVQFAPLLSAGHE